MSAPRSRNEPLGAATSGPGVAAAGAAATSSGADPAGPASDALCTPSRRRMWAARVMRWLPVVAFSVFVAVWHSLYPPLGDDLNYTRRFMVVDNPELKGIDKVYPGPAITTLGEAWQTMKVNYAHYNGRICHLFVVVMGMWPLWLRGVADGFITLGLLILLLALARRLSGRRAPPWLTALLALAMPLWLPMASMLDRDFFMNYFGSTLAALAFMALWLRRSGLRRWWSVAGGVVVAFLAGSMHEMWGLPLVAMVAAGLLWPSGRRRAACHWPLLAALLAGVAVCVLSPGASERVATSDSLLQIWLALLASPVDALRCLPLQFYGLLAAFIALGLYAFAGRRREGSAAGRMWRVLACPASGAWLLLAAANAAMCILVFAPWRASYPALFILALLLCALVEAARPTGARAGWWGLGVAAALSACGVAWLVAILAWQVKAAPAYHASQKLIVDLADEVCRGAEPPRWVEIDVPRQQDVPSWTRGMVSVGYIWSVYSELLTHQRPDLPMVGFGRPVRVPGTLGLIGSDPYYLPVAKARPGIEAVAIWGERTPNWRPGMSPAHDRPWRQRVTLFTNHHPEAPRLDVISITPQGDTMVNVVATIGLGPETGRRLLGVDAVDHPSPNPYAP